MNVKIQKSIAEKHNIPDNITYKNHDIELHIGKQRINRKQWWYNVRINTKHRRFVFSPYDEVGAKNAIIRAKQEIDKLGTSEFECFDCGCIGVGYGFMSPEGWGLVLDEHFNPQDICEDCYEERSQSPGSFSYQLR